MIQCKRAIKQDLFKIAYLLSSRNLSEWNIELKIWTNSKNTQNRSTEIFKNDHHVTIFKWSLHEHSTERKLVKRVSRGTHNDTVLFFLSQGRSNASQSQPGRSRKEKVEVEGEENFEATEQKNPCLLTWFTRWKEIHQLCSLSFSHTHAHCIKYGSRNL